VRRDQQGSRRGHRSGEREVAGGHGAYTVGAGGSLDLVEVGRRQARGADDDVDTELERSQGVLLRRVVMREVDEHVHAVEGVVDDGGDGDAERVRVPRRPEILPGSPSPDRGHQLEVVSSEHGFRYGAPGPAGRTGHTHPRHVDDLPKGHWSRSAAAFGPDRLHGGAVC
jgi:hypothetical protein